MAHVDNGQIETVDVDPASYLDQRSRKKREEFRHVIRALVEGIASLVEGQRCFADEFGLSYRRVFRGEYEPFKGRETERVIAEWVKGGEKGADLLREIFEDLARHQLALVEAVDQVAQSAMEIRKGKREKLVGIYDMDGTGSESRQRHFRQNRKALHQHVVVPAFVSGYAKARERMGEKTLNRPTSVEQEKNRLESNEN